MTTRKKTSSATPSGPVRVRAESNVIGHERGDVVTVERTPFVDALLANGHFTLTGEQPTTAPEKKPDDSAEDDA